jgi:antitoxin component of MazEF toxin-antitoxin module
MDATNETILKSLGVFTAGKVGNSIKVTIPATAEIENGTSLEIFQRADGSLVMKPQHVNIWKTDYVANHDFEADKRIIGNLDGARVGKEI